MRIDDPEVLKTKVTSLKLHTITFGVLDKENNNAAAVAFFTLTTFPSLKRCSTEIISGFPTAVFLSFLNRSSCSLAEFSVQDGTISHIDLVKIAKAQPSIATLKILPPSADVHRYSMFRFYDLRLFLLEMCKDDTDPNLLPKLQHLSIWTGFDFSWFRLPELRFPNPDSTASLATSIRLPTDHARGRVDLVSIAVTYVVGRHLSYRMHDVHTFEREPALIPDWYTFYRLLELKKLLSLDLQVEVLEEKKRDPKGSSWDKYYETQGAKDVFKVSHAKLMVTQGQPPQFIRESELFLTWVQVS